MSQPIRMMFTKNQNPFNLALRTFYSVEALFYETGALENKATEGIISCYYQRVGRLSM